MANLKIALTKGRLEKECVKMFEEIGFDCGAVKDKGRRLILPITRATMQDKCVIECVLAKAADVITYVSHGVCDLGVTGKDFIAETGGKYYEVADLGFGKCRFALAAPMNVRDFYCGCGQKIIATKYPNVAREFFDGKGMDIEIVKIEGSVELAPLLGFADGIVDIVETGATLKENELEIKDVISDISARLIVNPASMKLKQTEIENLINLIEQRGKK